MACGAAVMRYMVRGEEMKQGTSRISTLPRDIPLSLFFFVMS